MGIYEHYETEREQQNKPKGFFILVSFVILSIILIRFVTGYFFG